MMQNPLTPDFKRQINHQNKSTDKSGYYGKNTTIHFSRRYPFKIKIHIIYQRKNKPGKHANNTQYTLQSKSGNHNQFQNHHNNSGNEYQYLPTCRQSIQIQRCKIKYGSNQGGGSYQNAAPSYQHQAPARPAAVEAAPSYSSGSADDFAVIDDSDDLPF